MSKALIGIIKLSIQAGKATPAPPVGPALGQKGLNIMNFCKQFNDMTKETSGPVNIDIRAYADKSFDIVLKGQPTSYLIKQTLGINAGSKKPGREILSNKLTIDQAKQIAEKQMFKLSAYSIEQAMLSVIGTAKSMGIEVAE